MEKEQKEQKELLMSFGQHVRRCRQNNGLTQQELAEELKISTNHIGRIERGESNTTISNYYKLCLTLMIPVHFFDEMIHEDQN